MTGHRAGHMAGQRTGHRAGHMAGHRSGHMAGRVVHVLGVKIKVCQIRRAGS